MTAINSTSLQPTGLGYLPELDGNAPTDSAFKDMLVKSIHDVNEMQLDADRAVEAMSVGEDINPAQVLTAVQKADLAFRLTMQMRNKLMEVYQEVRDIRI